MDDFWDELRFVSNCVRLILKTRVEDSEFRHRYAILNHMVHIIAHGIGINFMIVSFYFGLVNLLPSRCFYN